MKQNRFVILIIVLLHTPFINHITNNLSSKLPATGDIKPLIFNTGIVYCQNSKEEYLTKTYIDTLILRAFYELNASQAYGKFQNRRQKAIDNAKRTAKMLRNAARNDPNSRYILWKVGELEGQIVLEEEDILQENQKNRQKVINHLVAAFNRETGKKRPDFTNLRSIHSQMAAVDRSKASEIDWLVKDRARGLSRDVQRNIESALNKKQLHKAQRELDYCNKNLKYLSVSLTTYSKLAARLKAQIDIDDEKSFVSSDLKRAQALLNQNELAEAGNILQVVHKRLSMIKGSVPQKQWDRYALRTRSMSSSIERKEDSLVTYNIDILNVNGVEAAMDYMSNVLTKKYGVSREKVGIVNNTIIQKVLAEQTDDNAAVSGELAALTSEEPEEVDVGFGDMALAAKQIAQARLDSIRIEEEKKDRKLRRRRRKERRTKEKAAKAEAKRLAKLEKEREKQRATERKIALRKEETIQVSRAERQPEKTYPQEQRATTTASASTTNTNNTNWNNSSYQDSVFSAYEREEKRLQQENEEKAKDHLVEIYTLLEQDQIRDAYNRFQQLQNKLKKYVYGEAFNVLQMTVYQAYQSLQAQAR